MSDEFASSDPTKEEKAKSPDSGLPYYVPASASSMRDKLPRINVPPSFTAGLSAVVASKKIPQFNTNADVLRYAVSVGIVSLQNDLKDPDFDGIVNEWFYLAEADRIANRVEAYQALVNKAEGVFRNRDSSPMVIRAMVDNLRKAISSNDDPYYQQELGRLVDEGERLT